MPGIAYALVAGLEPQYGLYSAFMGCFVYIVFGSSKDITIGPTAIMALMTGGWVGHILLIANVERSLMTEAFIFIIEARDRDGGANHCYVEVNFFWVRLSND